MDNIRSSISLNLSNQVNTYDSKNSSLCQFNFFVILGLDFLDTEIIFEEDMPITVNINKLGEISLIGIDGDILSDENTGVYSDRKVTSSDA